jgi:DHA1 family bicyclomycin/chloramphenicol resistance-like MFS transporter
VLQRELSASPSAVQATLTGSMVGTALGQLLVGPLSDAWGRRRPLLAGLGLHLVASLLCAVAPTVALLSVLRVFQGIGTAASAVIALAIAGDRFAGRGRARLVARLMVVIGASPVLAPSFGSALLGLTDWRGIFVVLGLMSLGLGLVVCWVLPETLPPQRRTTTRLKDAAGAYTDLLQDRVMVGLVVIAGLLMASVFGYIAASPFIFQEQYGLSNRDFALVFAAGGAASVAGSQVNGSLVRRFSSSALLTVGLGASSVAAAVLLVTASTGLLGLPGLVLPLWVTMFCRGFAQPNAPVLALERHGHAAGTAVALIGVAQFGMAALASPVTSLIGLSPATGTGVVMFTCLVLALAAFLVLVRPGLRHPVPHHPVPHRPAPRRPALDRMRAEQAWSD